MASDKIQKYHRLLREEFERRVSAKTGWGKNELMREFDLAAVEVLLKLQDED